MRPAAGGAGWGASASGFQFHRSSDDSGSDSDPLLPPGDELLQDPGAPFRQQLQRQQQRDLRFQDLPLSPLSPMTMPPTAGRRSRGKPVSSSESSENSSDEDGDQDDAPTVASPGVAEDDERRRRQRQQQRQQRQRRRTADLTDLELGDLDAAQFQRSVGGGSFVGLRNQRQQRQQRQQQFPGMRGGGHGGGGGAGLASSTTSSRPGFDELDDLANVLPPPRQQQRQQQQRQQQQRQQQEEEDQAQLLALWDRHAPELLRLRAQLRRLVSPDPAPLPGSPAERRREAEFHRICDRVEELVGPEGVDFLLTDRSPGELLDDDDDDLDDDLDDLGGLGGFGGFGGLGSGRGGLGLEPAATATTAAQRELLLRQQFQGLEGLHELQQQLQQQQLQQQQQQQQQKSPLTDAETEELRELQELQEFIRAKALAEAVGGGGGGAGGGGGDNALLDTGFLQLELQSLQAEVGNLVQKVAAANRSGAGRLEPPATVTRLRGSLQENAKRLEALEAELLEFRMERLAPEQQQSSISIHQLEKQHQELQAEERRLRHMRLDFMQLATKNQETLEPHRRQFQVASEKLTSDVDRYNFMKNNVQRQKAAAVASGRPVPPSLMEVEFQLQRQALELGPAIDRHAMQDLTLNAAHLEAKVQAHRNRVQLQSEHLKFDRRRLHYDRQLQLLRQQNQAAGRRLPPPQQQQQMATAMTTQHQQQQLKQQEAAMGAAKPGASAGLDMLDFLGLGGGGGEDVDEDTLGGRLLVGLKAGCMLRELFESQFPGPQGKPRVPQLLASEEALAELHAQLSHRRGAMVPLEMLQLQNLDRQVQELKSRLEAAQAAVTAATAAQEQGAAGRSKLTQKKKPDNKKGKKAGEAAAAEAPSDAATTEAAATLIAQKQLKALQAQYNLTRQHQITARTTLDRRVELRGLLVRLMGPGWLLWHRGFQLHAQLMPGSSQAAMAAAAQKRPMMSMVTPLPRAVAQKRYLDTLAALGVEKYEEFLELAQAPGVEHRLRLRLLLLQPELALLLMTGKAKDPQVGLKLSAHRFDLPSEPEIAAVVAKLYPDPEKQDAYLEQLPLIQGLLMAVAFWVGCEAGPHVWWLQELQLALTVLPAPLARQLGRAVVEMLEALIMQPVLKEATDASVVALLGHMLDHDLPIAVSRTLDPMSDHRFARFIAHIFNLAGASVITGSSSFMVLARQALQRAHAGLLLDRAPAPHLWHTILGSLRSSMDWALEPAGLQLSQLAALEPRRVLLLAYQAVLVAAVRQSSGTGAGAAWTPQQLEQGFWLLGQGLRERAGVPMLLGLERTIVAGVARGLAQPRFLAMVLLKIHAQRLPEDQAKRVAGRLLRAGLLDALNFRLEPEQRAEASEKELRKLVEDSLVLQTELARLGCRDQVLRHPLLGQTKPELDAPGVALVQALLQPEHVQDPATLIFNGSELLTTLEEILQRPPPNDPKDRYLHTLAIRVLNNFREAVVPSDLEALDLGSPLAPSTQCPPGVDLRLWLQRQQRRSLRRLLLQAAGFLGHLLDFLHTIANIPESAGPEELQAHPAQSLVEAAEAAAAGAQKDDDRLDAEPEPGKILPVDRQLMLRLESLLGGAQRSGGAGGGGGKKRKKKNRKKQAATTTAGAGAAGDEQEEQDDEDDEAETAAVAEVKPDDEPAPAVVAAEEGDLEEKSAAAADDAAAPAAGAGKKKKKAKKKKKKGGAGGGAEALAAGGGDVDGDEEEDDEADADGEADAANVASGGSNKQTDKNAAAASAPAASSSAAVTEAPPAAVVEQKSPEQVVEPVAVAAQPPPKQEEEEDDFLSDDDFHMPSLMGAD